MPKKIVVLGAAHNHVYGMAHAVPHAHDCAIVGVWDDDPQRLSEAARRLETPAFGSLEEALSTRPDLAIIAAVPGDRPALARRAIEAGAAALPDKPFAVTHEELDKSIEAVERFGRPIITFYPYRGHPMIRAARAALEAGRIGKPVRVFSSGPHRLSPQMRPDWHWTRAGNGGCMIDVGSHHVDIVCYLTGETPDYICAIHANIGQPDRPEFQDFAQAQLRFPGGVLGHVEVDWCTPVSMKSFGDTRIWIQGTTGKIELRQGDVRTAEIWTETEAAQPLNTQGFPDAEQWSAKLIEDLCHGRDCGIDQQDIWQTSRITLHAFDSAQAGGQPVVNPRY